MFTPPLTYESVRAWEAGETVPRPKRMRLIAEFTGVRYEWLAAGAGLMLTEGMDVSAEEVANRVSKMTRDERLLYLQAIAAAEAEDNDA